MTPSPLRQAACKNEEWLTASAPRTGAARTAPSARGLLVAQVGCVVDEAMAGKIADCLRYAVLPQIRMAGQVAHLHHSNRSRHPIRTGSVPNLIRQSNPSCTMSAHKTTSQTRAPG